MVSVCDIVPPGVVTGDDLLNLLTHARDNGYAIPAVNCTSSSTANACLEAAKKNQCPIIIQISNGGGAYIVGKAVKDASASVAGSIALAMHIRSVASYYGIPVIIHTDHCAKKLLPWFDGLLKADEEFFEKFGQPLFSSHTLDLSEEPDEENIEICVEYFKRMASMKIWLEAEITISDEKESPYTKPEQVFALYDALSKFGDTFSIAPAFGNAHGAYKPRSVVLAPERLGKHQAYVKKMINSPLERPIFLVMHGGSGSTDDEIMTAVKNGVVKMNVDTDTQWAYWDGLRRFEKERHDYLQGQIGNPTGTDKSNKKYYDPRVWLRKAEESMAYRVGVSCEKLGCKGTYIPSTEPGYAQLGELKKTMSPAILIVFGAMLGSAATIALKALTN